MALIGDVLQGFREQATDRAVGTLASPGAEVTLGLFVTAGVTLPAGNYLAKLAYRNPWGETLPGAESGALAVDATHGLQVDNATHTLPPGVTAVVLYLTPVGGASGTENQIFVGTSLPFQIKAPSNNPGVPAIRNTAYLPDSDGPAVSASAAYRWLNDGLKEAAGLCGGGLPDMTGVPSISGQGMYALLGQWWKLDRFWYDGYPGAMTGSNEIFRKNPVRGNYAMNCAVEHVDNRFIFELWPQPSRTSGSTTLGQPLSSTGLTATLVASNFTLGFGFAQISDGSGNTEIIAYRSNVAGTMQIALRGLGGTIAQAWAVGATVQELNIVFKGLRVVPSYAIGNAYNTLNTPPGWESALVKYLLHRFRDAERQRREAQSLYKEFQDGIAKLPLNKPVGGPRQIQIGGARGVETYPGLGSFFGGVIVP